MKKVFACFFTLALILVLQNMPLQAQAATVLESGMCGDNVTWTVYDDGRLVFSGTGATIDSNDYSVQNWYRHSEIVKHIVFEEGITYIGQWLFNGSDFYRLDSVTIPTTVTKIGGYAFTEFTGYLKSVYISDLARWCSINFTGNGANPLECGANLYLNWTLVDNLVIPENVSYIPDYAFMGCTSIRTVAITPQVVSIGSFAFNSCYNLGKMVFMGNAPAIGTAAFVSSDINAYYPADNGSWAYQASQPVSGITAWLPYYPQWDNIWSDAFPPAQVKGHASWRMDESTGTLYIFGTGAMKDYDSKFYYAAPWQSFKNITTRVVVEEGVTGIGAFAFREFNSLVSVSLPSTLKTIGTCAFSRCDYLPHLVIPKNVNYIGISAFSSWSIRKLVFLGDVPSLGSYRCLDDCIATVYYPADNITWTEGSRNQYAETVTWVAEVHDYAVGYSEATCTQPGNVTYICSSCGHSYTEYVAAPRHDYQEGFCTVCGMEEPPFEDVLPDAYYFDPVKWAVGEKITTGMSATVFAPDATCTRAQIVTFLWRAKGSPAPTSGENPFTDVPADQWYTDAVLWAVEEGITSGMTETTFAPDAPCTRGQVATFLHRCQDKPASDGKNIFTDIASGAYYYDAVLWAVENGITNGMGDGTFAPDAPCTRGQIVTFLFRTLA